MNTMTDKTERMRQRVGTTDDRSYVVLAAEVRTRTGEYVTTDHGTITDPLELAIDGEEWAAHTSPQAGHDCIGAGQNIDTLRAVTTPAPGWTLEEIAELADIWDRWHLNTMRAACAHMDPDSLRAEPTMYGTRISTTHPDNVCPVSGYQYGHAWLTEELPGEVVERVRYLMRDRSHDLYAARGYDGAGKAYPPNA